MSKSPKAVTIPPPSPAAAAIGPGLQFRSDGDKEAALLLSQQRGILVTLTKAVLFLCCLAVGFVLVFFQSVLVPFTIAIFLTYVIEPLVQLIMRLQSIAIGRCCCRRRGGGGVAAADGGGSSSSLLGSLQAGGEGMMAGLVSPSSSSSQTDDGSGSVRGGVVAKDSGRVAYRRSKRLPETTSTVSARETGLSRSALVRARAGTVCLLDVTVCADPLMNKRHAESSAAWRSCWRCC
jgi:hypothetical protein